jgi:hypothetical protein
MHPLLGGLLTYSSDYVFLNEKPIIVSNDLERVKLSHLLPGRIKEQKTLE